VTGRYIDFDEEGKTSKALVFLGVGGERLRTNLRGGGEEVRTSSPQTYGK